MLKFTIKFQYLALEIRIDSIQTKISPNGKACGEEIFAKSLGSLVQSSRKIQPPSEQMF